MFGFASAAILTPTNGEHTDGMPAAPGVVSGVGFCFLSHRGKNRERLRETRANAQSRHLLGHKPHVSCTSVDCVIG